MTAPAEALLALEARNRACTACPLRPGCTQVVVADGPLHAPLVVIGEAPGGSEDREGRPFVGPAGQLLDRILGAAGLDRRATYVTHLVKCRPPADRAPTPQETAICTDLWLRAQLALLRPRVIVTLGNAATQHLLQSHRGISTLRGRWYTYVLPGQSEPQGVPLRPLFHPAYLLRHESRLPGHPRSLTWHDIQEVAAALRGEQPPTPEGGLLF